MRERLERIGIGVLPELISSVEAKMRLNLVRAGTCGDTCPIDTLTRGIIEISGSRKRGARGLVGRIRIRGARRLGEQVDAQKLIVILPLAKEEGVCISNVLEGIAIEKGEASFEFTGADIRGKGSQSRGTLHIDLVGPLGCGVDCPIDQAERATVEFFNARAEEGGGLAVKTDVNGARKAGRRIDLPALRLDAGFRPNDVGICWAVSVFDVAIEGGRTARKALGQDVTTTMPRDVGTIVSPCAGVQLDMDDALERPVLIGGVVLGADRGSRTPNDVHAP